MNVRAVYHLTPVNGNFAADVTGDGRADLIEVNRNGILVNVSSGTAFGAPQTWATSVFSGDRETLFADVNGDGKADAIAVNNGGIFVMLSDGLRFNWAGQWAAASTYGARKTLAADVNGDHKADIIAVNNTGVNVLLSTGQAFGAAATWIGAFYGTRVTLAGDVNGDGKADLVAVGALPQMIDPGTGTQLPQTQAVRIAFSSGSSFQPQANLKLNTYTTNPLAAVIADANGDGYADYVTINDTGAHVQLTSSTYPNAGSFQGGSFSSALILGTHQVPAFKGTQQSLLADVDGDHKVDAIAINYGDTSVLLSSGASFGLIPSRFAGNLVAEPYYAGDMTGVFANGDFGTLYSPIGDWAPASFKGECGQGHPLTGLSRYHGQTWQHAVHCASSAVGPVQASQCYARTLSSSDNRGWNDLGTDWDPGNYKVECAAHEFVAGVAQNDTNGVIDAVLCCPSTVTHASCDVQVFATGDSPGFSGDDWDPGYNKGACPAGQYVAGISSPAGSAYGVIGGPHALLCCSP